MFGVVVIGRNEGERLIRCLQSALQVTNQIVYVDSHSTDDSVAAARALGVHVVELDATQPFSAARGRNGGMERLAQLFPDVQFVQFVDGDCELASRWIERGLQAIQSDDSVAVVCGRRKEREPTRNAYHQLTDMEWDTPCGEVLACGGDALVRRTAFEQVGGLDTSVIAGEEPELCARLRQRGFKILRIDYDMTYHDIGMEHFRQWWRRSLRSGYGAADVAHRLSAVGDTYFTQQLRSAWFWGGILPALSLVGAIGLLPLGVRWSLLPLGMAGGLYALQVLRIAFRLRKRGFRFPRNLTGAWLLLAAKPAQVLGQLKFQFSRRRSATRSAIEYK